MLCVRHQRRFVSVWPTPTQNPLHRVPCIAGYGGIYVNLYVRRIVERSTIQRKSHWNGKMCRNVGPSAFALEVGLTEKRLPGESARFSQLTIALFHKPNSQIADNPGIVYRTHGK